MEKRKNILLDVDEVICFSGFLQAINDFLQANYVIDDFTDYYIDEVAIPKEKFNEFNAFINKRNLYENAYILPNAVEVLKVLNDLYDIYICSSCINPFDIESSGRLFKDKYDFLREILPFIKPEHFIFTNAKHLFKADIQIDDRLPNLNNDIKTRILFPSYHNRNITDEILREKEIIRAGYDWREGWLELESILIKDSQRKKESPKIYSLQKKQK